MSKCYDIEYADLDTLIAQAAALRRLVAALKASTDEYGNNQWELTQSPLVDEDDDLAAAWQEVDRVCPKTEVRP